MSDLTAAERDNIELGRRLEEANDRIEALEAALESLTEDPPATLDEPDTDYEVIQKMRAIARAALSNGGRVARAALRARILGAPSDQQFENDRKDDHAMSGTEERIEVLEAALREMLAECDEAPTDNNAWVVALQRIARTALTPEQDK